MNNISKSVAKNLLRIKAVFLRPQEPFTWASGIKSPIYCDNRIVLGDIEARKVVESSLATAIKENYSECEVVMGTATAGIAHAAYVSDILGLPMGYVRSGSKDHGRNNQIEGASVVGKNVVVVEDLISTAGSSIETVNTLREAGANVLGIVSIFTYGLEKGKVRLAEANCKNVSLSNIDDLVSVALEEGYLTEREGRQVLKFISNTSDPSWQDI